MQPSVDLYRALVESSRDGLWLLDGEGKTLYANARMAELLGRTPDEMATLDAYEVHDELGREHFTDHLAHMRAGLPGEDNVESMYLRTDGTPIWLLVSWQPLCHDDGTPLGWLHRYTEYTERRGLLESMREREQLLAAAQTIAQIGSWQWNVATDEVLWSEQLYRIYNVTREDFAATYAAFLDFVHPEDRDLVMAQVQQIFEGAEEFSWDARIVARGGEVKWVRGLGQAERDRTGQVIRMGGTAQDITKRVLAEKELADAARRQALLRTVAEAANQATSLVETLVGAAGAVSEAPGWAALCAYVLGPDGAMVPLELVGDRPSGVVPDPDLAARSRASRQIETVPLPGQEATHSLVAMPIRADDEVVCVVQLTADESPPDANSIDLIEQVSAQLGRVAERERAEAALAEARDQAMEASRLKSEFLATMSHEIRTPMNGILGLNDLLLRTDLQPRQRQLADALHNAGLTLRGLINDILDLSKIEAGKLELEVADFRLGEVWQQVLAILTGPAQEKGLELVLDVEDDVPLLLRGDSMRLVQVISNLGSNAVKFTEAGGVHIHCAVEPDAVPAQTRLRITVRDSGPGIESDQVERLFGSFTQLDPSTTRRHGGTGLGLAISRQIVALLGGDLTVESEIGVGSAFTFTAAFGTPAHDGSLDEDVPAPLEPASARVLVVEDNEINQMVAVGLLESAGFTADVVGDGEEAVAALIGEHPYAAVLMDIQMPRMDGYAATRTIRLQEPAGRHVPVIAMTASALQGERERCLAVGMDDFLAKPVDLDQVVRVLRQQIARGAPVAAPMPHLSAVEVETAGVSESASTEPTADEVIDVIDMERVEMLAEMVKDGESLFHRASGNFLAHTGEHLAAIRSSLDGEDATALRASAHKFKGSALNLGLKALGAAAYTLEQRGDRAMAGQDGLEGAEAELAELTRRVDEARAAVERERSTRI